MVTASIDEFRTIGFAFVPAVVDGVCLARLDDAFRELKSHGGTRHLIEHPAVGALLESETVRASIIHMLSKTAFAYKATLFDKHDAANWGVAWHRDTTIPVLRRAERSEWTAWSVKEGVDYVQPPRAILFRTVALRINIDACGSRDGPLRVLAGSHLDTEEPCGAEGEALPSAKTVEFLGAAGDGWLMNPMLLHASSKAMRSARRRVLHLEFADFELPGGLKWHRQIHLCPLNRGL